MKISKVTSKYYFLRCGHRSSFLKEGDFVNFKYSKILEGWLDIYIDSRYRGTIPENEFKTNFDFCSLRLNE